LPEESVRYSREATPTPTPTPTPPYNLYFAIACVVVGAGAYILTMLVFKGLIEKPADVAIVSGALGVLFTFIGTLAGAYFGIKSTQDTTDKAAKQVEAANARTERAHRDARWALREDQIPRDRAPQRTPSDVERRRETQW
jgi:hypothetical protein